VDPPHDGYNLSFDGGDERTDGSDGNTMVNVCQRDFGPPASQQLHLIMPKLERIHAMLNSFWEGIARAQCDDEDLFIYLLIH
jgi:hypothetical protein